MSNRQDKKLRKQFRKDYKRDIERLAEQMSPNLAEHINPKPRWMPGMVYHWCMRVVLK